LEGWEFRAPPLAILIRSVEFTQLILVLINIKMGQEVA
jgi:hypothetical protein